MAEIIPTVSAIIAPTSTSSSLYDVNLHYLMVTEPLGPSTLLHSSHDMSQDALKLDDATLLQSATQSCQALLTQLFHQPLLTASIGEGEKHPWTVSLPMESKWKLPRCNRIPEKRPETRWEKFAKERGIAPKRTKSKKVFDEETQTWRPSYGYRSKANDEPWLIPVKEGDDPYKDVFEERRQFKKQRVEKNDRQHHKNLERQQQQVELNTASFGRFSEATTKRKFKTEKKPNAFYQEKQIAQRVIDKLPDKQDGHVKLRKGLGQLQQFEERQSGYSKKSSVRPDRKRKR